jgi:hypothetical protein
MPSVAMTTSDIADFTLLKETIKLPASIHCPLLPAADASHNLMKIQRDNTGNGWGNRRSCVIQSIASRRSDASSGTLCAKSNRGLNGTIDTDEFVASVTGISSYSRWVGYFAGTVKMLFFL